MKRKTKREVAHAAVEMYIAGKEREWGNTQSNAMFVPGAPVSQPDWAMRREDFSAGWAAAMAHMQYIARKRKP